MESYKYLIVGGGIAGITAAETIRQKEPAATIAVVNDEPYALYSRVMLSKPNFFLGKIPFEQVWLKGEEWLKKNTITFIGGRTAVFLDTPGKAVLLDDGRKISYEKLLVAVGVRTRPWGIQGADKKGIHYLRTLDDGKAIMEGIKTAKRAVVIGGGFIGFEMADLLKLAGLETTILLRESYFWQPMLDETSGRMIEKALTDNGVEIIENMEAAEVVGGESVEAVILKDGTRIPCEMIICGIGTTPPQMDWIKNAGVNLNRGILANEYMETNMPDIFTAGDIAEYKDLLLEENIQMGNWVNAHEQGRIAGMNMMGGKIPFKFVSFYTTQGMGISIAFVGDARPLPDRVIIQRGSVDINSYARILIVGKELVGATMINRTKELTTIAKLIENNVDVSRNYSQLGDPNFDLKQLLPK